MPTLQNNRRHSFHVEGVELKPGLNTLSDDDFARVAGNDQARVWLRLNWIQLPAAGALERQQAAEREQAEARERAAETTRAAEAETRARLDRQQREGWAATGNPIVAGAGGAPDGAAERAAALDVEVAAAKQRIAAKAGR